MTDGAQAQSARCKGIARFASLVNRHRSTRIERSARGARVSLAGGAGESLRLPAPAPQFCCFRRQHFVTAGWLPPQSQYWGGPDDRKPANRVFESINIWCAVAGFVGVAIAGVATWQSGSAWVLERKCFTCCASCIGAASCTSRRRPLAQTSKTGAFRNAQKQRSCVAVRGRCKRWLSPMPSLSLPFFSSVSSLGTGISTDCSVLSSRPIAGGFPGSSQVGVAALLASFSMIVGVCLLIIERRLEQTRSGSALADSEAGIAAGCSRCRCAVLRFLACRPTPSTT